MNQLTQDMDYCEIGIRLIVQAKMLGEEIYVRLNEGHYVQVFQGGNYAASHEELMEYMERKGLKAVYIRSQTAEEFISKYRTYLAKNLIGQKVDREKFEYTALGLLEACQELYVKLGSSPELAGLLWDVAQLSMQSSLPMKELLPHIDHLKTQKEISYIAGHSWVLALFAVTLSKVLEWKSQSTKLKLALAAILHDIALSKRSDIAQIQDAFELESRSETTDQEKIDYWEHGEKVADFLHHFESLPSGLNELILCHHERPDGTGFPKGSNANLLSEGVLLFIACHDFVRRRWLYDESTQESFEVVRLIHQRSPKMNRILADLAIALEEGKLEKNE